MKIRSAIIILIILAMTVIAISMGNSKYSNDTKDYTYKIDTGLN